MKYYRGWISIPIEKYVPRVTEKAIGFTLSCGYTDANDRIEWFPKSQLIIGEPNDVGNAEILIPLWLLKNKRIDGYRIREIRTGNGIDDIVER